MTMGKLRGAGPHIFRVLNAPGWLGNVTRKPDFLYV
jgi:hypothetical protein